MKNKLKTFVFVAAVSLALALMLTAMDFRNEPAGGRRAEYIRGGRETQASGYTPISIKLEYNSAGIYDAENDGKEPSDGVIDFSVKGSGLDSSLDETKLCTRWSVYSMETHGIQYSCFGNRGCCAFLNLSAERGKWDEILYLTYGMTGSTENNIIGAQVIHLDYSLSVDNPYSRLYYSDIATLPASFTNGGSWDSMSKDELSAILGRIARNNARIGRVSLADGDGKELEQLGNNDNVSIFFRIPDLGGKNRSSIIAINNFNPALARWDLIDGLSIASSNDALSRSLGSAGISAKAIVSLKGVDEFISGRGYQGYIGMDIAEPFNKVVYCSDDNADLCKPLSECRFGIEKFLKSDCYEKREKLLEIFIPHFSSVIVGVENRTWSIVISSPDNATALKSGENVFLDFLSAMRLNASYSLDGGGYTEIGEGNNFTSRLAGMLPFGILSEGGHDIALRLRDSFGNESSISYHFEVDDHDPPEIDASIGNNSAFSGSSLEANLDMSSSEHARISYNVNGNGFSSLMDLGENNSRSLGIKLRSGRNNLTIFASDYHDNSNLESIFFDYRIAQISSCSDAIQNGNESGIDCGGNCQSCINFSIRTDKPSYFTTENVQLLVISLENSNVNVSVSRNGELSYQYYFVKYSPGYPISETRTISNTSLPGSYLVSATMRYFNITEIKNVSFDVAIPPSIAPANPLFVSLRANSTEMDEGAAIHFESSASGTAGPFTYRWDLETDGMVDSQAESLNYTYPANGTYLASLNVSDSNWSRTDSRTITIRKVQNVTIIVRSNSTGIQIDNAEVIFDGERKNTSSDGKSAFVKNRGTYSLKAAKNGYADFSNKTEVSGNEIFDVYLADSDLIAPEVKLSYPDDKSVMSNGTVTFRYVPSDKSRMACRLFLGPASGTLEPRGTDNGAESGAEHSFLISGLGNGNYEFSVTCTDFSGNSKASELRSFTIDTSYVENILSVDLEQEDIDTDQIMSRIDEAISGIDGYGSADKEAAEDLNFRENLEKSKTAIQRANRDLHSLKWRRLNKTELESETKTILERIESLRQHTPVSFEVLDKSEFVRYPNKEDIGMILQHLINDSPMKFARKDMERLGEENQKIQSMATITTKARLIEMETISGAKIPITLVKKTIETSNDIANFSLYEIIPKEFASNLSEIELLFDYEVIDNDPVVRIDVRKVKEFSYYAKKSVSMREAEKIKSVLLARELKPGAPSGITGFAVMGVFVKGFEQTTDVRLLIELTIIMILVSVFLYYQFGLGGLLADMLKGKDIREVKKMIDSASGLVNKKMYDDASRIYKNINSKFGKLNARKKGRLKEPIAELINRMNVLYIDQMLGQADGLLKSNRKNEANAIYLKIRSLYGIIPKSYKAEVSKRCLELHGLINSK